MKTYLAVSKKNIILFWSLLLMVSCNRRFDIPPVNADPDVTVNMTIAELKERYQGVGIFQTIYDEKIISGVITANDRTGNFYKQIIIQDETGAIPVLMDGNNVYTSYPTGRRVFIRLQGMMLGDYGGTIQLGLDSVRDGAYLNLGRIPAVQFDQFILKGSFGNEVVPKQITPDQLSTDIKNPLQSMLVQLNGYQFSDADTGKTYADPLKKINAVNFTIRDCQKKTVVLRNSSYAGFAGLKVPEGNGMIVGIYSLFTTTQQLFIRDTADVQFRQPRCGQGPLAPLTIAALRQLYTGTDRALDRYRTGGTVISDAAAKNHPEGSVVLQSGNRGIVVHLGDTIRYLPGDSLVLTLSDEDSLMDDNGTLTLKMHEGFVKPVPVATGRVVVPEVRTIAAVNAALELPPGDPGNIASTLITIAGAGAGAGVFGEPHVLDDATGTIELFTREEASFAQQRLPGGRQRWTGYAGVHNSIKQFSIRNTEDVTGFVPATVFSVVFNFGSVHTKSGTTDPTPIPVIPHIRLTPFRAVNVGANPSAGGRFSFTSWPQTGFDAGKYYEILIQPEEGKALHISTIRFTFERSGTGVQQVAVRSGRDHFAANLPAAVPLPQNNIHILEGTIFQVKNTSGSTRQEGCTIRPGATFTDLRQPVVFRFYGFYALGSGGTFSIDDVEISGSTQ
ncbi:DUF5689 domain-containing protein [Niabella beijingensis]|uniref:DUF5689 domain-containing protein n=1 Tax=Niabella beijingensis TaxID=2872700 RepID=UPI001CBC351C|nr:DUF5689 domain-containing protein [Niabella beijingensis]MBZ4189101.1 DUF5689 domain-containing protein [Niabella beijingensis]